MIMDIQAWHKAERAAFEAMMTAISGSKEGQNAFCGELPDMYNAWSLITGGGPSQGPWNKAMKCLRVDASIVGVFIERQVALGFAMSVVNVLGAPFKPADPVLIFRGGGQQPKCGRDYIEVANTDKAIPVWTVEIPCEMVFSLEAGG